MADDTSIRGTVEIASADSAAKVAYDMASQIWLNSHDGSPKIADSGEFLELVRRCVRSLQGHAP